MVKKRSLSDIVVGFFLLCHPVPVLFHCVAVSLLALLAAWPHPILRTFLLVVTAHMAMQLSIAVLNDYCDRHLDAQSKRNKPIPRGLVQPYEAAIMGLLLMVVMFLLLLPLNPLALLVSLLYLALGQGYNLGLKATPLSGIVFALAIPLIPVYAFAGMGHMIPLVFWLVPVVVLLSIALNLANSLPDIEQDKAGHAYTLAVVLGVRRSFAACALLIMLAVLFIAVITITRSVPARSLVVFSVLGIVSLAVGFMLLFFGPNKAVATRKLYFYLVVVTCLVLVGGWLIGAIL